MKLCRVIPTLDEAANISALLARLSDTPGIHEVVVADGGSTNGTLELVRVRLDWFSASRAVVARTLL